MVNTYLTNDGKDFAGAVSTGALTASSSTGNVLIPRQMYSTIIEAVRNKLVLRQFARMIVTADQFQGSSLTFPTQEPDTMEVEQVSPGAEIPLDAEEYAGFTVVPVKYGVRVAIDKELIEDGAFAVMEMNMQTAGYELGDNEESLIVLQLAAASAASSNDVANSNATIAVTDITQAMQSLEYANYDPDVMVIGAEVANDLRNLDIFTAANMSGVNNPSNKLIGRIFNMAVVVSNKVSTKVAFVFDSRYAFLIVEKRPVTMEAYFEAARDRNYVAITHRIGVRYVRADAVAEITTT